MQLNTGCSVIGDLARGPNLMTFSPTTANVAANVAVNHAILNSGSANTGVAAAGGAAAVALSIQAPTVAKNGAAVPITIVGLDLITGESARIYAGNCEVMEITNYGKSPILTLTTQVKMDKSSNAVIRVESSGRDASSSPINVISGSGACNQSLGLNTVTDLDFAQYGENIKTSKKSIRLTGQVKGGTAELKARLKHPMETGNKTNKNSGNTIPAHYITNISIMKNQQEIATIKTTPTLAKNPQFDVTFEIATAGEEITLLWRDNKDSVVKNSYNIQ